MLFYVNYNKIKQFSVATAIFQSIRMVRCFSNVMASQSSTCCSLFFFRVITCEGYVWAARSYIFILSVRVMNIAFNVTIVRLWHFIVSISETRLCHWWVIVSPLYSRLSWAITERYFACRLSQSSTSQIINKTYNHNINSSVWDSSLSILCCNYEPR